MLGVAVGLTVAFIFVSFNVLTYTPVHHNIAAVSHDEVYKKFADQKPIRILLDNDTHMHHGKI